MREFELLDHIHRQNAMLPHHVTIPPGDDLGALELGATELLVGVDQVIDGRHVNRRTATMAEIGAKAIGRSLSDVAAMAAEPRGTVATAALPADMTAEDARELSDAMRSCAAHFGAPLIGGDVAVHATADHPLTITVTVLAVPGTIKPVRRDGARAGDVVYVTGALGATLHDDDRGPHLHVVPRLDAARTLAHTLDDRLHAMIDLSDGLGQDAAHLARASRVEIELDAAAIPCRDGASLTAALSDGEDYELLFCAADAASRVVPTTVPSGDGTQLAVTPIGRVLAASDDAQPIVRLRHADGSVTDVTDSGWEHRSAES